MSNDQWNADQSVGERAIREWSLRRDHDSALGDDLRASGVRLDDVQAVRMLYERAGQSGSYRIVSALRAIETWLAG